MVVEVHSYWKLFFAEVLNPFYVFQIFSVCLWFFDEYEYYAFCVLASSAFSIGTSLYQLKEVCYIFFPNFDFGFYKTLCCQLCAVYTRQKKTRTNYFYIICILYGLKFSNHSCNNINTYYHCQK